MTISSEKLLYARGQLHVLQEGRFAPPLERFRAALRHETAAAEYREPSERRLFRFPPGLVQGVSSPGGRTHGLIHDCAADTRRVCVVLTALNQGFELIHTGRAITLRRLNRSGQTGQFRVIAATAKSRILALARGGSDVGDLSRTGDIGLIDLHTIPLTYISARLPDNFRIFFLIRFQRRCRVDSGGP
jgi:hypothetical protein